MPAFLLLKSIYRTKAIKNVVLLQSFPTKNYFPFFVNDPAPTKSALPFPTVFFARYQVWQLTPLEIDEMLSNGYFRSDLHVHTTLARYVENAWRPSLMVRISLTDFRWKKSLRKLFRRNNDLFEIKIRPFEPREEIENLWQKFKTEVHQWSLVPNLTFHLFRGNYSSSFQTWEVSIYENGQLIAFSIFDKGLKSIASLEAAYDPEFRKYSLGIFTMLTEISFCISNGMDFYYPGFYPRETPMFDYKLRPGNAQFYRLKERKWYPWDAVQKEDWLLDQVFERLREAKRLLKFHGLNCSIKVFNITNFPGIVPTISDYNILLAEDVPPDTYTPLLLRVAWDPIKETYLLFSKEMRKRTFLNIKIGNGVPPLFGSPFYFDSSHEDLESLEERVKKILAKKTNLH
jgi:arginine-tRNA-protein transferase